MDRNPFSEAEIAGRLVRVRTALAERKLDAAVFASPENVFY
ncbi:MAG: aminopeptidase P family protein, partial [Mesorhizobium sp.]